MIIKPLDYIYEKSKTELFQGTYLELQEKLDNGCKVIRGGNGSYVLATPSEAKIEVIIDNQVECMDVKQLIRDVYDRKKVTKKAFETFKQDIESGIKRIDYDYCKGLRSR